MKTHSYGDQLAWGDLSPEHQKSITEQVVRLGLGNPEVHWSAMDYKTRWESTWRFENPHEDAGAYKAEVERIKAQADAETIEGFKRLAAGFVDEGDEDLMLPLVNWATVAGGSDEDLIEGVAIRGRWTQIVAAAKQGKSSLLLWMAVELSEGRDPWDQTPQEPVRVLWLNGEMGPVDLAELIGAFGHDPLDLKNLFVVDGTPRLDTETGAERLLARVDNLDVDLVVCDGLNGFVSYEASENDTNTWLRLVALTINPLKRRHVAVISADNLGKDKTRGSRGSSAKTDKADGVIAVSQTDDGIKLEVTHSRAGAFLSGDLYLGAEGFDRSIPIRYWRVVTGVPHGTLPTAQMLDSLAVPVSDTRRMVQATLKAEVAKALEGGHNADRFRVSTTVLSAAIRYRRESSVMRNGSEPSSEPRF